jgi:hypothetical protein
VLILGSCWAADWPFTTALRRCLGRDQVLLVASTAETSFDDASRVYLPVLDSLAKLECPLDPGAAYAALVTLDVLSDGRGWTVQLLDRTELTLLGRRLISPR